MIRLPGLIDTHVHLREPGATQKEDFATGTKAAIAGGYTVILDMPNNPEPTVTPEALEKKISLTHSVIPTPSVVEGEESQDLKSRDPSPAKPVQDDNTGSRIFCDVGFHFGATVDSIQYFQQVKKQVFGLKVYMNHTTGTLLQEDPDILQAIFSAWPKDKILMVHAEGQTLEKAISLAKENNNKLHVCHVSLAKEISLIRQAKMDGLSISCEVGAHHLFLTEEDVKKLGPYGMMRPPLATRADQQALWDGIQDKTVDIIASDHAPHTKTEKQATPTPNGVPGLETTLPLLLTAVGRLAIDDITQLCHTNPAKIFNIKTDENTFVEIDETEEYEIKNENLKTKCKWSPFNGWKVKGKVKKVILRGQTVFENGEILAEEGSGKIISPQGI